MDLNELMNRNSNSNRMVSLDDAIAYARSQVEVVCQNEGRCRIKGCPHWNKHTTNYSCAVLCRATSGISGSFCVPATPEPPRERVKLRWHATHTDDKITNYEWNALADTLCRALPDWFERG